MSNLRRAVFVDMSAFFAIANSSDENHETAVRALRTLVESGRQTVTSNHVFAEFHALMVRTFGQPTAIEAVDTVLLGNSPILRVSESDEVEAMKLLRRFIDKRYTLVDAMSFVLIQNHRIPTAFTFDRHFLQHGISVVGLSQ